MITTWKNPGILLGLLGAFLLLFTGLILPVDIAYAHPTDMYAQDQSIEINTDALHVEWKITPGPLLANTLWNQADVNQDGAISQEESRAWMQPYLSQWQVTLDGNPLDPAKLDDIRWPTSIDAFQTGGETIDIQLTIPLPAGISGTHDIEFHNAFQESISLDSFTLKSAPGIFFSQPDQSASRIRVQIDFSEASGSLSTPKVAGLQNWESGEPQVPGLTGAVSSLALNLANPNAGQASSSIVSTPTSALTSLIKSNQLSPFFLLGAFLLSIALGSLHALTPGHGKTLVAAYLVGSHGKVQDAIFLGLVVTLTHTGSVLILGLVTLVASRYILPTVILPWLEILSGLFVILFGLNLFFRRGKVLFHWAQSRQRRAGNRYQFVTGGKGHDHPTHHSVNSPTIASHSHQHSSDFHFASTPHDHPHDHPRDLHTHGHSHTLPEDRVTWRSLLGLGISGGLVPCPDAIAILLVAVAVNRITLGMILIVAFSLGLALVLIGIGIAMVQGLRLLQRNDWVNRFSVYSPVASSVVVVALGVGLSFSAIRTMTMPTETNASVSSVTGFETAIPTTATTNSLSVAPTTQAHLPQDEKILYTALDQGKFNQLFMASISGQNVVQYTRQPQGIPGYALSPDEKEILYSTLNSNGGSSIWLMDEDGTNAHQILDCPSANCGNPIWSPDSQKVIYERDDYNQPNLGLFSLWWLDLKNDETQSVFSDPGFPGYGPAFSADSHWLSYISPSKNAIEIYSLTGAPSRSIPNLSNVPPIWSPEDDSLLYWDLDSQSSQSILQLRRYDLNTNTFYNLSGEAYQQDYPAAWSPDGQWVAVIRSTTNPSDLSNSEQVWLIKPDGTQAHVFLGAEGFTYSHIGWSPDSQALVFSRYANNDLWNEEIWMADIHSAKETRLISAGSDPEIIP